MGLGREGANEISVGRRIVGAVGFRVRCGAASMCTDGWDAVLLGGRSDGVFGGQSVGGKSLRSDWPDTMTLDQGFNK